MPFSERNGPSATARLEAALREVDGSSFRNPLRLAPLQRLCVLGSERRGGPELIEERPYAGAYGELVADVAPLFSQEFPLCISAKCWGRSRHQNRANRLGEMPGEAVALRGRDPEAVLGYLCVIAEDQPGRAGGHSSRHNDQSLAEEIALRCVRAAGRSPHHFDAGCVLLANLKTGKHEALNAPGLKPFEAFLDQLVLLWHQRANA